MLGERLGLIFGRREAARFSPAQKAGLAVSVHVNDQPIDPRRA
jgi:hypothetical protein